MTLENYIVKDLSVFPSGGMTGRRKIKTTAKEVTAGNVVEVLQASLAPHSQNAAEISYLYNVYRGQQDVLQKTKMVRENINNKVTVNRANEIVTFKSAYLLNEPIQYISNGGDEAVSQNVNRLNEYMRSEDKESKDKEIVDWMHICGVGVRLVLDDKEMDIEDGAPFCVYTLDPRRAYVIYRDGIGELPLAGVILQRDENQETYADVYTKNEHFVIKGDKVVDSFKSQYGGIPLVEYVNNDARLGAFEIVLPILNGINTLESNAIDSVEDFVNGFDVFQNCDIEDGTYSQLALGGKAVKIKTTTQGMEAKVYRIASELSQSGTQTRIDDLTDAYLTICGMPNRNGGSSTSDTGTAVIFRDGFAEAESRAKDTEKMFTRSEREMLRIVLKICDTVESGKYSLNLRLSDIKTEFLRKNLSNLQSKVQVLCELLNNPKVHPKLAFEAAGLFKDNEEAYRISQKYYDEYLADQEQKMEDEIEKARAEALRAGGSDNQNAEQDGAQENAEDEAKATD